jgi:chemotaxis protein MotB
MSDEAKVRIIVKKIHGRGHHGGAWKVAYADFVTTMMALFIVLWITAQSDVAKQAVARYFKDPGLFKDGRTASSVSGGDGLLPAHTTASPGVDGGAAEENRALKMAAARIKQLTEKGGAFEQLRDQTIVEMTEEGLRIELRERDSIPFFRLGSAVLIPPLKPMLESLQRILGELPNHITVEGHTDGHQYSDGKVYSNWELSADRANAARRALEAEGLRPGQIDRVVGHADRLLTVPAEPLDASNRRITILVRREKSG